MILSFKWFLPPGLLSWALVQALGCKGEWQSVGTHTKWVWCQGSTWGVQREEPWIFHPQWGTGRASITWGFSCLLILWVQPFKIPHVRGVLQLSSDAVPARWSSDWMGEFRAVGSGPLQEVGADGESGSGPGAFCFQTCVTLDNLLPLLWGRFQTSVNFCLYKNRGGMRQP